MFSLFDYFFRDSKHKELGGKTLNEWVLQETRQKDFEQLTFNKFSIILAFYCLLNKQESFFGL